MFFKKSFFTQKIKLTHGIIDSITKYLIRFFKGNYIE